MIQSPLSEQPDHISALCQRLGLGTCRSRLRQVSGGLHHRMWRLTTDYGRFAVKQLAAEVDINDANICQRFNATEAIAAAFAASGFNTIHALRCRSDYLQIIGADGYLVYPWTDARAQPRRNLSERHALKVAHMLARMHQADIHHHELQDRAVERRAEDKIRLLVQRAMICHARDYEFLQQHLPALLTITAEQTQAEQSLSRRMVISHGDLDQKNVLWNAADEPIVIDWESARRVNPTREAIQLALDWSGISTAFEPSLFDKFINAYRRSGGIIAEHELRAAFICVQGEWLDWLMYNVGRSFDLEDAAQRSLGGEQVDLALSTLLRLQRLMPSLLARVGAPKRSKTAAGEPLTHV